MREHMRMGMVSPATPATSLLTAKNIIALAPTSPSAIAVDRRDVRDLSRPHATAADSMNACQSLCGTPALAALVVACAAGAHVDAPFTATACCALGLLFATARHTGPRHAAVGPVVALLVACAAGCSHGAPLLATSSYALGLLLSQARR